MTIKTAPYKAVSFVQSAVEKALDKASYLIAEVKYDGVRGNICVDNTANVAWLSRVSKEIPALSYLNGFDSRWQRLLRDDRCIFPDGFMLDGELMVKGTDFNTGSGLLRTKNLKKTSSLHASYHAGTMEDKLFRLAECNLEVVLYAVLPLHVVEDGSDHDVPNFLMPEHVKAMIPLLQEYFPEVTWSVSEGYDVFDMVELQCLYEKVRAEGHEGLVVKDPMDIYRRGKKTGWWKMKPLDEADGVITGLVWGTPGLANEGKVIGFEVLLESGRVVNACNISRALMDEFTEEVVKQTPPEQAEWVNPYEGWACQIGYMEETKDGSLRHPSFTCFRGTEDNPTEKI